MLLVYGYLVFPLLLPVLVIVAHPPGSAGPAIVAEPSAPSASH